MELNPFDGRRKSPKMTHEKNRFMRHDMKLQVRYFEVRENCKVYKVLQEREKHTIG